MLEKEYKDADDKVIVAWDDKVDKVDKVTYDDACAAWVTYDDACAAWDAACDAVEEAYDKWQEELKRDKLMTNLRAMSTPSIIKNPYRNRSTYTVRNPETGTTMTTTIEQEANSYCDSLEQQGITYIATVEIDE